MGSRERVRSRSLSWYRPPLPYEAMWVIGGQTPTPSGVQKCHWSKDGESWQEAGTDALPLALLGAQAVVYEGAIYVIGGWYYNPGATYNPKVYRSTDGVTWAEVGLDALPAGGMESGVAFGYKGAMWIVGGYYATGASPKVYQSATGEMWTEVGVDSFPTDIEHHAGVIYEGYMWTTGGIEWTPFGKWPKVYYSADGLLWSEAGLDACPNDLDQHAMCVYDGRMWISGGRDATWAYQTGVYWSTDGITWTLAGNRPVAMGSHTMLSHEGRMWVMGEMGGVMLVYHSRDGATWIAGGGAPAPAVSNHVSVVYPPTH